MVCPNCNGFVVDEKDHLLGHIRGNKVYGCKGDNKAEI